MLGGDLNSALDPFLDVSRFSTYMLYVALQRINKAISGENLVDVSHLLHPNSLDYTFCSAPHNSYSCLDFFFLHNWHYPCLKQERLVF